MKNIFLVLIPSLVAYAGCVGSIVYASIKRDNYQLIKICVFAAVLVFLIVTDIPCYKDISKRETTTVTAEYVKFQSSSTLPCTRKAFFRNQTGQIYVYVPIFTRDIAKMEVGKTYEIEYFNNSHIIKEYKLLE